MSFTQVLNLSISASWLVLAIVLARLILKNAPKALHCALWALVAIRLLCPVSFESEMSLIPSREVIPESYLAMEPADMGFTTPAKLEIVTNPVYEESVTIDTETTVDRVQSWDLFASVLWLAGMGAMGIYAAYSYLSIRLRVRMAGWTGGRVWECDDIDSPFILGLLRPRIYLPSNLDEITRVHVLAHENAHLKRLDHIWKPLGFALLTVHWFNPVMWVAYVLLCRDIELACDEKVIRRLDKPQVRAYSEALVRCSVSPRRIAMCPLAFGEVGVKGRIRSMLNYRKPGFWVMVIAVIVSIAMAACFLTDPVAKPTELDHIREEDGCTIVSQTPETLTIEIYKDFLPENVLNGRSHTFEEDEFLLHRTETTTVWLESARMFGNELLLTLNFRFQIPESGELLLPYRFENGGREWTAEVSEGSDARIVQYGPDPAISVAIPIETYQNTAEYITFELTNMNRLVYRADHLVSAPTTAPQLDAIIAEEGYHIRTCTEETVGFMFYTHWLPDGFEGGYDFADGEMVMMETQTTTLQMIHAQLDGGQYRFDFAFTYDLPASGTIITPYYVTVKGISNTLRLDPDMTHDFTRTYPDGITLAHEPETEGFSLLVDKAVYDGLDDYLSVTLEQACAITYTADTMELPAEDYLFIRERYEVGEYERFLITYDLHLIGCEPEILFPIERDLGALHVTSLEGTPVSDKLKRDNLWAWRCEAYGRTNLLLQQEDGKLYVLTLSGDGSTVREQYRIEKGDESRSPEDAEVKSRSFTLGTAESFDRPMIQLYSDGTFMLHISSLSSYIGSGSYTLTREELVLKTADGRDTWCFDVTDAGFAFDAERSNPIGYYPDWKNMTNVRDGELFRDPAQQSYEPPAVDQSLEEAISAAILSANGADQARGGFCIESHRLLAELMVCGAASVDGEPTEELIVYLYAMFRERSTNGERTYFEPYRIFPAKLSFTMTDSGYELTEYLELTDDEAMEEFPAFAYEDLVQNRDKYDTELAEECREKQDAYLATLQEQMTEAERLFDTVASYPAQDSDFCADIPIDSEEWQRLLELDASTVHYSFSQLATGEEQGLRGFLMAQACQEIIRSWGEACRVDPDLTAQDWFSKFSQQAEHVSGTMTWEALRDTHPACALAIIHTQWQKDPPP